MLLRRVSLKLQRALHHARRFVAMVTASLDGSTFVEVDATSGLFSVTITLDARGAALVRASWGSA
jgi:hypothetical protein